MSYQSETNWMDELDSKLRNLEELEAARAKEAWEKHVVRIKLVWNRFFQCLYPCYSIPNIFLHLHNSFSSLKDEVVRGAVINDITNIPPLPFFIIFK